MPDRHIQDAAVSTRALGGKSLDQHHEIVQRFIVAWQVGERPEIETYLRSVHEPQRGTLLKRLLFVELEVRRTRGETPVPDDYVSRFSEHAQVVGSVFVESGPDKTVISDEPIGPSAGGVVRYSHLSFHAAGGLGEIYRAHDDGLKRQVALKFIQQRHLDLFDSRERFFLEAEITSRLDHPGVVPVFAMGETADSRPFYAMRFVEGHTLRKAFDDFHATHWGLGDRSRRRMELLRLLSHLVAACNTIAYANNRGVIHRDIKPDNIMIGKYQETLVMDWGFALPVQRSDQARATGEKTLLPGGAVTDSSSVTGGGTIGYMSPEQLPTSNIVPAEPSDVYSLGATLYKLLTGRPAIQGRPTSETFRRIREGEFPRPRQVDRTVPPALEAVCLKAMSLRPEDRYASALDMASDLQRWMADEPVSVHREPRLERLLRSARRHRSWTMSLAVAAGLVLAVSLVSSLLFRDLQVAADDARNHSLQQSSMFAARMIANDIQSCWHTLRECAGDPDLRSRVSAAIGQEMGSQEWIRLQELLASMHDTRRQDYKEDRWQVLDSNGRTMAITASDRSTVGKSFAHRDYYHNRGHEYDPNEIVFDKAGRPHLHGLGETRLEPTVTDVLSICHQSMLDNSLRVGCTVPIWKDGHESVGELPIGLLVMTTQVGEFKSLQNAILVDTREDSIENNDTPKSPISATERQEQDACAGLVLQHPLLHQQRRRVEPAAVERFRELIADELGRGEKLLPLGTLVSDFVDPLAPDDGKKAAAISPVIVKRRSGEKPVTGWVVIVPASSPSTLDAGRPRSK